MGQLQLSTAVQNARLDAIETQIGTAAVMKIYSGAVPANCGSARTGTVLATLNLPSDWMLAASGGSKAMSGSWADSSADAAGTAGYFTIFASDGTTVGAQGDVTATGGGGVMTVDNTVFAAGQGFTITGFTIVDGNS